MAALPQTRQPADCSIICKALPRVQASVINMAEHTLRSPSYKWLFEFDYRGMEIEDARALVAFANARWSLQDIFTVYHPASTADAGGIPGGVCRLQPGGTQTVTVVSGRDLTINGWDTGLVGNLFEPGDLIGVDNAKEVLEVETAVTAGPATIVVTVTQFPRRPDLTLNSPVTYLFVPFYVRMADEVKQDWTRPVRRDFVLRMREANDAVG